MCYWEEGFFSPKYQTYPQGYLDICSWRLSEIFVSKLKVSQRVNKALAKAEALCISKKRHNIP